MQGNASLLFAPDGYETGRSKLMGRHAAGEGFLRAYVQTAGNSEAPGEASCLALNPAAAGRFRDLVAEIDARVSVRAYGPAQLGATRRTGTLYLPGPDLGHWGRLRDADNAHAYSLCGVTHTISSIGAIELIQDFLSSPVTPWDSLVCTSRVVRESVEMLLDAREDFLLSRLGVSRVAGKAPRPALPIIPLGVDTERYAPNAKARAHWRQALGIGAEDVAFLFMGRLSFHAKAHPLSMFQALEAAIGTLPPNGPKVHLILAGWFANEAIERVFREGAKDFAPNLQLHVVDGRENDVRFGIWSAADVFLSLSDNYQETFGLTPIEAMACGLPVVVSDWNGYRDTVPDGVVGFRIPTMALPAGGLADLALAHASGHLNYDHYLAHTCQTVSVDLNACTRRCVELIGNPGLRSRMGEAARRHAVEFYDWKQIMRSYRSLWADQAKARPAATPPARKHLHFPDPTQLFSNYPTATWQATDQITANPDISSHIALSMYHHPLWAGGTGSLISAQNLSRLIDHLQGHRQNSISIGDLTKQFSDLPAPPLLRTLAWLFKWGGISRRQPRS